MSTAQTFAENNPEVPEGLARAYFEAVWSGNYEGPQGALALAKQASQYMEFAAPAVGGTIKADFFMLSANYSAATSAIASWKNKKNVAHLMQGVKALKRAVSFGDNILKFFLLPHQRSSDLREDWASITRTLSLSEMEVLMSPYFAVAEATKKVSWMAHAERKLALRIGSIALAVHAEEYRTMPYGLVAAKVLKLGGGDNRLRFQVMRISEDKSFPLQDRARLCTLLGEHELAKKFAEQSGLRDASLKAGG